MSRALSRSLAATLLFAGLCATSGCTHNHYYYPTPGVVGTPVMGEVTTIHYGDVCDVPQSAGGAVVAQGAGRTTILPAPAGTRVVVSQPQARGPQMAWRRPAPESGVTTRVAGGIDDDSTLQ